jgi:glycosyltransferase involved in cell wall biosynthesis
MTPDPGDDLRVVALVPARDEASSVGETVQALRFPGIDEVVVVDDGSDDGTASAALAAGATVLRIPRPAGKGAAMEGALRRLPPADVWLFADADLGASAGTLSRLVDVVISGSADLTVAVLPPQPGGGLGNVKRGAAVAVRALSGFEPRAPLSGQRAITAGCLAAVRPLAAGFGVETAMTIDAIRAGFRVFEVPLDGLTHRPTGRGPRGFAHRGRQGLDIARAVMARAVRLR